MSRKTAARPYHLQLRQDSESDYRFVKVGGNVWNLSVGPVFHLTRSQAQAILVAQNAWDEGREEPWERFVSSGSLARVVPDELGEWLSRRWGLEE